MADILIEAKIRSGTPGGTVVDDTQINDTRPGHSNIHEALENVTEPDMLTRFF